MTQPVFPDFGRDLTCLIDEDPAQGECSGLQALLEALARRLQTPLGSLLGDPNYGYDLLGEIDDDIDVATLGRIGNTVDAEFVKDPRVLTSSSVVTTSPINGNGYVLTLTSQVVTALGPFALVFGVGATIGIVSASPSGSVHA